MKRIFFCGLLFLICAIIFPAHALAAANLSLSPASGSYTIGNNFSISVNIDTGGDFINAAEAYLTFDNTKFTVSSLDTSSSIFSAWPQLTFSNAAGTIHFAGGLPSPGFKGSAGSVLKINFKGIALGTGNVDFEAGANKPSVLLNDGLGTEDFGVSSGGAYTIIPPALAVSCSASPNSTTINNPVTFSASASGESGSYTYSWAGSCTGTASTCTNSFASTGVKTSTVTASSNGKSSSGSCSTNIGLPGLNVFCSSPSSVDAGQPITFNASASGGNGSYNYFWSNACTGNSSDCTQTYSTNGLKTATVTVTSGSGSSSANCVFSVNAVCPTGVGVGTPAPQHTICSSDEKCVVAVGDGQDQCHKDDDCKSAIAPIVAPVVTQIIEVPVAATQAIAKTVNTPQGSVVTKAVSTTAIVATAVTAGSVFSLSLADFLMLPLRLFSLLLVGLGLKRKVRPWGVVYDSVTKQPLDPAYVTLKTLEGKEVASSITDLDGRFGFLVEPGVYQISARKTNYVFPSQKLAGKTHDELYSDIYFGDNVIIKKSGETIIKNIPLDPVKFDWNEFAKKDKNLMKFYSKWNVLLGKSYDFLFALGFIAAIVAYIFAPHPYNTIIIVLYLLTLLLRVIGPKPRTYGYISDKATGVPLSFPLIHVIDAESNREIASKSADRYGKYYCLIPPGKYYVKIDKKNDDASYSLVYTSPVIDVSKKGIIKEKFKV